MGSFDNHYKLYESFKKDAENKELFEGTRVEGYFLAAYHLIEACAAKERIHINKHHLIRKVLQENLFIFGDDTDKVWSDFQTIENQLRPKFAYGFNWSVRDLDELVKRFVSLETICLKVLKK
jgi:hypothetical protein